MPRYSAQILICVTYARRQVISCVMKASTCHLTLHAKHWHFLWKIPQIIAVKSNVTTFIQVPRFVVNMFCCGRVAFTVFKHTDIKGVRQRLTSAASLDDGYCEATSLTDTGATRRLVANQREVMTRLLELLYVLNIKRNIF